MSKLELGPAMAAGTRHSESTSPAVGEEVQERARAAGRVFGRVGPATCGQLGFPETTPRSVPEGARHPQTHSISVVAGLACIAAASGALLAARIDIRN